MAWADEKLKGQIAELEAECERLRQTIRRRDITILKLKGKYQTPSCPCGHPEDHAGWCPRKEA